MKNKMNEDIKILSFSSPKGGVGRTMTLANCARIYSNGASWAGIEKSITILVDLDFHAPGIHYYNFEINTEAQKNVTYRINENLSKSDIGLIFLLSKIIEEPTYLKKCALVSDGIRKGKEHVLLEFQDFVNDMLKRDEFNPAKHLIQSLSTSIYILPAGSPNNPNYNATVFKFEWFKFMNVYMGLYLLDCIFYKVIQEKKTILENHKPVRILLDQQAGSSVAAAINRSLADAHILVGGFNKQNQSGLKSLVDDFRETYIIPEKRYPWIVLNQYDGRKIALDYSISGNKESPHCKFSEYDKTNREKYKKDISQYKSKENREDVFDKKLFDRIYVTEFDKDAIQKEHFYETDKLSFYELTKLLVSIEFNFNQNNQDKTLPSKKSKEKITFIGERVKMNDKYSGPFNGVYGLLKTHFFENVVALAATHEDIYQLSKNKKIKIFINVENATSIASLEPRIYDISTNKNVLGKGNSEIELSLNDLDFISYPYHCLNHIKESITSIEPSLFYEDYSNKAEDTLNKVSFDYCAENILRWKEYCIENEQGRKRIFGVPLFVNFQLLAYRNDYFLGIEDFHLKYRQQKHRDFIGFQAPGDLLDFVEITTKSDTSNKFLDVYLSGNPENIAKWYEWQTIFSIFYSSKDSLKENQSLDEYETFLKKPLSVDAFKNYFKLFSQSKKTESDKYTWDKLLEKFYGQKNGASLIFIWPDAIPNDEAETKHRASSDFIYQAPPSFHIFEECWMFSIVKKEGQDTLNNNKVKFLNFFLTPQAQTEYTITGGLPTHKAVLSSLDLWKEYAFLSPLWSVYFNKEKSRLLIKRESFSGIYEAGLKMGSLISLVGRLAKKEDHTHKDCHDAIIEKLKNRITQSFKSLKEKRNGKQE